MHWQHLQEHELAWDHNHEGDRRVARERKRVYSCSGVHQQTSVEIRKLGGLGGELELLLYTTNQTLPLFVKNSHKIREGGWCSFGGS